MKRLVNSSFIFTMAFAGMINLIASQSPSQAIKQSAGDEIPGQSGPADTPEEAYFDYLSKLNYEQPKKYFLDTGGFLRKTVSSAEGLAGYKIEEYRAYLSIYFPGAHSDHIQRFLIETYIGQKEWTEVLAGLLKFAYLYQDSPLKGPVIENGSQIVQEEEYFASNRDNLLSLIQGSPETDEIQERYFEYLTALRSLNAEGMELIFKREAWEFMGNYADYPRGSSILSWLAEVELANGAHHPAFMIHARLMTMYPDSPEFSAALYRTARFQQERFSEFEQATANFRKFLEQFPEDSLVADVQYRIAAVADENLGDWETAVAEYEQLATKYPQSPHTVAGLLRMGEIQAGKLKLKEDAISTYKRIASEYPENTAGATEALQRAGKLYEKSKSWEAAIEQYMAVHNKYPSTEGALESLEICAVLYEKKIKRNDKAREILNTIVMDFPDTKSAKKAAKRLKKLK